MPSCPRLPGARPALMGCTLALMLAAPALVTPALAAPQGGMSCGPMAGPSRLTVTGSGQAQSAPDLATIRTGVTSQAATAAEVMALNSRQSRAVIEALTGAGIAAEAIQTSGLNLMPQMSYAEGEASRITGYQATNQVTVRVADLARLGEVLDAVVAAGANEIGGIEFTREDAADSQDEARRLAVEDARRKAGTLASAAGLDLGPVLSIRDSAVFDGGPRPMMRMEAAMADSVPVQPGQVEAAAQVEIDYALTGEGACAPAMGPGRDRDRDRPERDRPDRERPDRERPDREARPDRERPQQDDAARERPDRDATEMPEAAPPMPGDGAPANPTPANPTPTNPTPANPTPAN